MPASSQVDYPSTAFLFLHGPADGESVPTYWWAVFRNNRLELMLRKDEDESFPDRFRDHSRKFAVQVSEERTGEELRVIFSLRDSQQQREAGGWTAFSVSLVTAWAKHARLESLGVMRLRFAVGKTDETGKCPHLNSSDREKLFPAGEGIKAGGLEAILRMVKLVRDVEGSREM